MIMKMYFERLSFLLLHVDLSLYIEWNLIRLGGPSHGIVTKTLPVVMGVKGWWGGGLGSLGGGGVGV